MNDINKNNSNKKVQIINDGEGEYTMKTFDNDSVKIEKFDQESVDSRAQSILDMIRTRNISPNPDHKPHNEKLKEMLEKLKQDGTTDQHYTELPGFSMGFDDGLEVGYDRAASEYKEILRAIRTLLDGYIKE